MVALAAGAVQDIAGAATRNATRMLGGGEAAAAASDLAARAVVSGAFGTKKGTELVRFIVNVMADGGEAATRIAAPFKRFMGKAAYRVEVSKIMNGAEGSVMLGGKKYYYAGLLEEAQLGGVMDGFDATALREDVNNIGFKFLPAQAQQELAEAIGARQRLGLYATLLEEGMTPQQASKGVVDALYDYTHSMSAAERDLMLKAILPFWRWQKNANRQMLSAVGSPSMMYRIGAWQRGRRLAAEWIEAGSLDERDPYGVYTARLEVDPQAAEAYASLKPYLDQMVESGKITPAEVQQLLFYADMRGQWNDMPPEVKQQIALVQTFTEDPNWQAHQRAFDRDNEIARLRWINTGEKGEMNMQRVWQMAVPPSGMAGATKYLTAWATGYLTLLNAALSEDVEVWQAPIIMEQQVADPTRIMPVVAYRAIKGEEMPTISKGMSELLSFSTQATLTEPFTRHSDPKRDSYRITDPALAFAYTLTGAQTLDAALKRSEAISEAVTVGDAQMRLMALLSVMGISVRATKPQGDSGEAAFDVKRMGANDPILQSRKQDVQKDTRQE